MTDWSKYPDWVVRNEDFVELYDEAITESGGGYFTGIVFKAEYTIPMMMLTRRTSHLARIEQLISEHQANIDETKKVIRKHLGPYAVQKFNDLVSRTEWKRSRGEL